MTYKISKAEVLPSFDSVIPLKKLQESDAAVVNYLFWQKFINGCVGIIALLTFLLLLILIQAKSARINYYNKDFYVSAGIPQSHIQAAIEVQSIIEAAEQEIHDPKDFKLFGDTSEFDEVVDKEKSAIRADMRKTCDETQKLYKSKIATKIEELNQTQQQIYQQKVVPYIFGTLTIFAVMVFCFAKQQKSLVTKTELTKRISFTVKFIFLIMFIYSGFLFLLYGQNQITIENVPLLCGKSESKIKFLTQDCFNGEESCYSIWNRGYLTSLIDALFLDILVFVDFFGGFLILQKCINLLK